MAKIFDIIYQITAIPLHISFKKLLLKSFAKQKNAKQFEKDVHTSTYFQSSEQIALNVLPLTLPISFLQEHSETVFQNANEFCNHNFTYLGVSANHNRKDKFEATIQEKEYANLLKEQISNEYHFLDWQQDFQSNYRFSEHKWYKHIAYEYIHGIDAKNPIEFGRMQHLPHLVYAGILTSTDNNNKYIKEFQHQILDFIVQNPPRFGIQWLVSMDVGIRLFNIVVAYSIARSHSIQFSSSFETILVNSIVDHCTHIYNNLEWSSGLRGNHYLANLTGLLSGALLLPNSFPQKSLWVSFACEQLLNELLFQFQDDGSNFEDSTCYHRLSAEIELFGIALVVYASEQCNTLFSQALQTKIDSVKKSHSSFNERIVSIINFTTAILYDTTSKTLLQIGDDDSGQLCKLQPNIEAHSTNNALNSSQLLEIFDGFMGRKDSIVSTIVANLLQPFVFSYSSQSPTVLQSFLNFGLFRYNQLNATIFFHCNESLGQLGKGGHTHNDVLSILLSLHNQRILVDPGTFTYTPYPDLRNKFRSTSYHNTLSIEGMEQNILFKGTGHNLFWLRHTAKAKMLYCDEKLIVMEHYGFGKPHRREVQIEENRIIGKDYCSHTKFKYLYFHFAPECSIEQSEYGCIVNESVRFSLNAPTTFHLEEYDYSPQYGVIETAFRLKVEMKSNEIQWRIDW